MVKAGISDVPSGKNSYKASVPIIKKVGGRRPGAKGYNLIIFFKLLEKYLPNNALAWQNLANEYNLEEKDLKDPRVIHIYV